jgi:hypothetical protein
MPRKLNHKAFAENSPLRSIEQQGRVSVTEIGDGSISYQKCDWYSPNVTNKTGAIQLPRGTTSERPTVVQGGRENVTFDLTVSQPDIEHDDPSFNMMDPWMWTWTANYNRTAAASNMVVENGQTPTNLVLFRGSKYTFRNFTVGHSLFLKSQALSEAEYNAGQTALYRLGTDDGVTNNGLKRTVGSEDPGVVVFDIPEDYPHNQVVVQHYQYGMANVIPVQDPPAETIGYLRLNTDLGTDATTGVGVEVYTGQGWIEVGSSPEFQIQTHPTGSLTTEDWNTATGSEDWNTATGTDDWGGAIVSAFLADGNLSVNDDYAVVAHDGSTGGGIPMLRADMSNLSVDLVNTKYNFFRANNQTLTDCNVSGSAASRLVFANVIERGIGNVEQEDSNKRFRINKDVTNSYFKFELKLKPSADCTLEVWKNGSKLTYADYAIDANYHATISWIEAVSFNDTFEFRLAGPSSVSVTNTDTLLIEFIGS